MTITVGSYWIPLLSTFCCVGMMLRPYHEQGDYDIGRLFRLVWLFPMSLIWTVYFAILLLR